MNIKQIRSKKMTGFSAIIIIVLTFSALTLSCSNPFVSDILPGINNNNNNNNNNNKLIL